MSAVVQHPRAVEMIERRKLRKQVARAVDRLIAILNELDGDPEAEPWLGAPDVHERVPQWPQVANDDREDENEHGADDDAGEETLGWNENVRQLGLGANTADGDSTAPERHGGGFVRCRADDLETDDRELAKSAAELVAWYPTA